MLASLHRWTALAGIPHYKFRQGEKAQRYRHSGRDISLAAEDTIPAVVTQNGLQYVLLSLAETRTALEEINARIRHIVLGTRYSRIDLDALIAFHQAAIHDSVVEINNLNTIARKPSFQEKSLREEVARLHDQVRKLKPALVPKVDEIGRLR